MQYYDDDRLLDKIEDYLRGKLPAQEAADFERQIAADPVLAETVDMMRIEQQAIELMFREELRAKLEALEKSAPMSELAAAAQHRGTKRIWLLAALLALLVAGGVWFFLPVPELPTETTKPKPDVPVAKTIEVPTEPTTEPDAPAAKPNRYLAIAERFYLPPQDLVSQKLLSEDGNAHNREGQFAQAVALYEKGDFGAAAQLFSQIPDAPIARRWEAHAFFRAKNFGKAAAIFQAQTARQTNDAAQDEAEWYLLLCHLSDYPKHRVQADTLLQKMTNPANQHAYREQATGLQARLRANGRQ